MKKRPKPASFKPEPPPRSNSQNTPSFQYQTDEKEPTLDDRHPLAAKILHVLIVTIFITLGGTLLTLRSGGGIVWILLSVLIGVGYGVYSANKNTS